MKNIKLAKIIKCENPSSWYCNKIGETFEVYKHPDLEEFYTLTADADDDTKRLIRVEDCEIIAP